jgi:hypothetical protein
MNDKILDEFLSEDGDADARRKLLDVIRESNGLGGSVVLKHTFNRFNVRLDLGAKQVIIEDDLMIGEKENSSLAWMSSLKPFRRISEVIG